ncbi:MAG: glycosyl hydrolase [Mycobacteriales bacterium]
MFKLALRRSRTPAAARYSPSTRVLLVLLLALAALPHELERRSVDEAQAVASSAGGAVAYSSDAAAPAEPGPSAAVRAEPGPSAAGPTTTQKPATSPAPPGSMRAVVATLVGNTVARLSDDLPASLRGSQAIRFIRRSRDDPTGTLGGPWTADDPPSSRYRDFLNLAGPATYQLSTTAYTDSGAGPTTVVSVRVPAPRWKSGVFVPGGDPASYTAFGVSRGRPIDKAMDFLGDDWSQLEIPNWWLNQWADSPYQTRMVVSLAMLPANDPEATIQRGAAGEYDERWRLGAQRLVAAGMGMSEIRLGYEFNGEWFRWRAAADPAAWVAYYRRIVDAYRSVPGESFTFNWNPNIGRMEIPAENAWPGDDYVDIIGLDVYDQAAWNIYPYPARASAGQRARRQEKAWQALLNGDHGLAFWGDFATLHRKKLAFPEWGLTIRQDGQGGGDNPYYIRKMLEFCADPVNRVEWETYFNVDRDDGLHKFSQFPAGWEKYRQLIAAG